MIFGKNDVGKSNIIRALNLFFNEYTDTDSEFDFDIDFCDRRREESNNSDGVRKFVYVKVTFNTPSNYHRSLGKEFYVKRQWTISRGQDYVEEISNHIKDNQRHIVTRFMNQIRFIHIPAIKDNRIFSRLLSDIYEILANSTEFTDAVGDFASRVQFSTAELFSGIPKEIAHESKISAPSRMDQLFETLDFETTDFEGRTAKSLTLQRGDGIKARHIPEILNFICSRDGYQFHIWGFEEPENSLDFVSAEAEALRFARLAGEKVQVFVTTHSPSFYNLSGDRVRKFYVTRDDENGAKIIQGRQLEKLDVPTAIGEGFYLPAVAKALEEYSLREVEAAKFRDQAEEFRTRIASFTQPVVLTEGKTDEMILLEAWKKLRSGKPPYKIKCCDITDGQAGGAAGASQLALSLRTVPHDNPHVVIGIFDRDEAGYREWKLDANFSQADLFSDVRVSRNSKAFGMLLQPPAFRQANADNANLPIEFLFPDEFLDVEIDGKCLLRKQMEASRKVGEKVIRILIGSGTEYQLVIESSKMDFASKIVPKLPAEAFIGFSETFDAIDKILTLD